MTDSIIPEGARCTDDLDFVLLTALTSYRSQIVRLAAVEKGAKWKHFAMDIVKANTQLDPWYVKLNPKAYVPTLVYGNLNTSICESAEIMKAIDEKWDGTVRLQQACIDNQEFMDRFEELYKAHEDWDVETYSMGAVRRDLWIFKWVAPTMLLRQMNKARNTIRDKTMLDEKLKALDKRYFDCFVDYDRTKPIDDEKARVLLQ